jgi:hypothetical protein
MFVCQRLLMKSLLEKKQDQDSALLLSRLTNFHLITALSHLTMSRYHPTLLRDDEGRSHTAHLSQFMDFWFDGLIEAADNLIKTNISDQPVFYLTSPFKAKYVFNESNYSSFISHQTFLTRANDTNVILVSNGANLNLSLVNISKYGYSTNIDQASFFGVNAAINVQNGSHCFLNHLNVITHNGAANIYSHGNGTYVFIEKSFLYSSGPVAHGLYAGGYGTVVGKNIIHYSSGYRSSSFAGDAPTGSVSISDSVAYTSGIGSAIFYTFGVTNAVNVVGYAKNSPALFADGDCTVTLTNCKLTAGLLGGVVIASSNTRTNGTILNLTNSRLTTLDDTMPGFWFGNVVATIYLYKTIIDTTSGILVVANYSTITQEFNHYADYSHNSLILPAIVTIYVVECSLSGSLIAYNGSSISWLVSQYSTWSGDAYSGYAKSYISVSLDSTSAWSLTNNTLLQNFTSSDKSLRNISSNGYNITYDSTSAANSWLHGRTILLNGGGKLMPAEAEELS